MYALTQQYTPGGPRFVHELFEEQPELHPDFMAQLFDVSDVPGIAPGWELKADGTFTRYVPPIEDARAERIRFLRFECRRVALGGFKSSALGQPHTYGSSDTDQVNIDRAALAGLLGGDEWVARIQCVDEAGKTDFVEHTAKQAHQVAADLHAMIEGARLKLVKLTAQVMQSPSVAIVNAIVW